MSARKGRLFVALVRTGLGVYLMVLRAALRLPQRRLAGRVDVLATGSFVSQNWLRAHLQPLAAARNCRTVWMVATRPVPDIPNVHPIYPWRWLSRTIGDVPARLLTFAVAAVRLRPHVVAGFHLLFNGLAAALVARTVGARSVYLCVGGPAEILGGGIQAENRLFGRLRSPEPAIERQLTHALRAFDLIVTMGSGAARFVRDCGCTRLVEVMPGGIDGARFTQGTGVPETDLLLVGRLVPLKRVDLFLLVVRRLLDELPTVTASIVGDGPLRAALEQRAADLQLGDHVTFRGARTAMHDEFARAGVFVLTSETEGLSLALMEAMMCGLPAVVPDVGDLADLVEDGVSGFLVRDHSVDGFADAIARLLRGPGLRREFSAAARRAAARNDMTAASARWQRVLAQLAGLAAPNAAAPEPVSGPQLLADAPAEARVVQELGVHGEQRIGVRAVAGESGR